MELSSIIAQDGVFANLKPNSKKQLLQELAAAGAAHIGLDERTIFDVLLQREKLGSTGVGNGVAIPHGKLPQIPHIFGILARLQKPIAFDAMDEQPVDIVFMLLAPEGSGADHLKALSRIARVLRDQSTLTQIRNTDDAESIHNLLTSLEKANAA